MVVLKSLSMAGVTILGVVLFRPVPPVMMVKWFLVSALFWLVFWHYTE